MAKNRKDLLIGRIHNLNLGTEDSGYPLHLGTEDQLASLLTRLQTVQDVNDTEVMRAAFDPFDQVIGQD